MLVLVRIDLSKADLTLFDEYEEQVLALIWKHRGQIKERLRATDDRSETHLLLFPDEQAFMPSATIPNARRFRKFGGSAVLCRR